MAESKPTKLQMAKEIQHLIAAAQDMSAVMDLDPVIKTDYLIDLKNKTVTATHLQNVVANLQADIKRDASIIEPEDKFDPETHKVLADLNVKVPRPATKEEAVEDDEDELEPTASLEIEETEEVAEKEKPIKKEKKNAAGTTEKISQKPDKLSRFSAVAITFLVDAPKDRTEWAEAANDLFVSRGGKGNVEYAKHDIKRFQSFFNAITEAGFTINKV